MQKQVNEILNLEYASVCFMSGSRGTQLKISGKNFPTKEQVVKHHNQTGNIDLSLMKVIMMMSDVEAYKSIIKTVMQAVGKDGTSVESGVMNGGCSTGDITVRAIIPYGRYCRTVITIDATRHIARVQFNRALIPVNDIKD